MNNLILAIQTAVPAEGWEMAKGVMMALTTLGVGWTAKTVFFLRDDVRDLKRTVGTDGSNGLKTAVASLSDRLGRIEDRNSRIDAVAEAERRQYPGPERRRELRRLRDSEFLPAIPPVDEGDEGR